MDGFSSLATVLKRCKLHNAAGLTKGNRTQMELRNSRAINILRGMIGQEKNKDLLSAMRIEMEFLKTRERYFKTNRIKKSLLNRAVFLAQTSFSSDFEKYTRNRRELFINKSQNTEDADLIRETNALVQETSSLHKILKIETEAEKKLEHSFADLDLVFYDEETLTLFKEEKYAEVTSKLKNTSDFESSLVLTIAKIEKFKKGLEKLKEKTDTKSKKTLTRYLLQWKSLYQTSHNLFLSNFIKDTYLENTNKEVSTLCPLPSTSLPLHPITYDLSSVYINLQQNISGVTSLLKKLSIFR